MEILLFLPCPGDGFPPFFIMSWYEPWGFFRSWSIIWVPSPIFERSTTLVVGLFDGFLYRFTYGSSLMLIMILFPSYWDIEMSDGFLSFPANLGEIGRLNSINCSCSLIFSRRPCLVPFCFLTLHFCYRLRNFLITLGSDMNSIRSTIPSWSSLLITFFNTRHLWVISPFSIFSSRIYSAFLAFMNSPWFPELPPILMSEFGWFCIAEFWIGT